MADRRSRAIGFGVLLVLVGLLLVWGGLTPLSQHRDADGYLLSDSLVIDRASHAVVTADVGLLRGHYDCAREESLIFHLFSPDDVRTRGVAAGDGPLFLGVAPADAVGRYLDGVPHDEITEWDCDVDDITPVEYTRHEGSAAPDAAGSRRIWVASASGDREQTLDWTIEDGAWAVVIMNADASRGVSAAVRFGALAPGGLETLAWTSFAVGLVATIAGTGLIVLGSRRDRPASASD